MTPYSNQHLRPFSILLWGLVLEPGNGCKYNKTVFAKSQKCKIGRQKQTKSWVAKSKGSVYFEVKTTLSTQSERKRRKSPKNYIEICVFNYSQWNKKMDPKIFIKLLKPIRLTTCSVERTTLQLIHKEFWMRADTKNKKSNFWTDG